MSPFFVGLRIWLSTIFLNSFFSFLVLLFAEGWKSLAALILLFLLGIVFALPVLPLIIFLIKISARLPYHPISRIVWLCTCFSIIIILFYGLIKAFIGSSEDLLVLILNLSTLTAMALSVYRYRRPLIAFYNTKAAM